jgi:phosphoglycolate phosphatase-like HAD superfamily hydrolase
VVKLIVFDWDEVFTKGSTNGYIRCYHEALKGVGVSLSPEEELKRIHAKWGSPHLEELRELLKEKPELLERANELYEQHLFGDTFVDCLEVVPGSQDLLRKLAGKYILTIASGVHPKILKERVMPKFDIPDVFAQIVTAYDLEDPDKAKPHPRSIELILEANNVAPEEAVMVGDAENDVLMGRNAGVEPVVVLSGHLTRLEAEKLDVSHIIDDVTHLEEALINL